MRKTQALLLCILPLALLACVATVPIAISFPPGQSQPSPLSPPSAHTPAFSATLIVAGVVPTATSSVSTTIISHFTVLLTSSVPVTPSGTGLPLPIEASPDLSAEVDKLERAMADALNRERTEHELVLLRTDERLGAIARTHAEDMIKRNYFAHTSPDGVTVSDRLTEAGLVPLRYGENLIYGVRSFKRPAQVALEWFMDSEPHRKNILHPAFTRVGVGAARLENGSWAFVLDFAAEEVE